MGKPPVEVIAEKCMDYVRQHCPPGSGGTIIQDRDSGWTVMVFHRDDFGRAYEELTRLGTQSFYKKDGADGGIII
jgi:hypothetical protein